MHHLFSPFGIELTTRAQEQLELYYELLIEANSKFNLTTITDKSEVYLKHFADSASAQRHIKQRASVLDMGSGAGFPGVVLAIVRQDLQVTLVDSQRKRVDFLQNVVARLGLGCLCVHARAEDFKERSAFDCAVARAVAPLNTLLEYTLPFVKSGGSVIAYKAVSAPQELIGARNALSVLGATVEKCDSFMLPDTDMQRTLIIIKKLRQTPPKYPRGGNKPKTQPL